MPDKVESDVEKQALIIFLLDVSVSMEQLLGTQRRIDAALWTLEIILERLIMLSRRGNSILPRYRIAIFGYSNEVYDLLGGTRIISDIHSRIVTQVQLKRDTHTAYVLQHVETLLQNDLPHLNNHPAPLICHLTDAEDFYHVEDPEPTAQRIMQMVSGAGNVLIENIIFRDGILPAITDPKRWRGILPQAIPENDSLKKIGAMSSVLPESYRRTMIDNGFSLDQGVLMIFPGTCPELAEMVFR